MTCKQVDYDARNNRPVAQCFAGDDDLQAMMVAAGWAWSFGQYSQRYARGARGSCREARGAQPSLLPPWEWRAQQRAKGGQ